MIELKNVCKKFDRVVFFKNLNMQIEDIGITGIVGKNGCGKTVLSRIISGVYKAEEGEVLLDGMKIYENFRAKINLVFVSEKPDTAKNMTMDKMAFRYKMIYPFDDQKYKELKERFGLNGKEKYSILSSGQISMMHIIIALCCKCKYTIIDGGLDRLSYNQRMEIIRIMKEDFKNRSFVVATQDDDVAMREYDHIINMEEYVNSDAAAISDSIDTKPAMGNDGATEPVLSEEKKNQIEEEGDNKDAE